jgi:hypothetical protein
MRCRFGFISVALAAALGTSRVRAGALPTDFVQQIAPAHASDLIARLDALNHDIVSRGMLPLQADHTVLLTGYAYSEFYDWDLYFENIYLSYYGISDFCFSNLKVFLDRELPDGFISRSLKRDGTPDRMQQHFKPFLAQIAVLGSRQRDDDFQWLNHGYYDRLKKYLDRWFKYDPDGNGLPVWDSADASGMDNQVRRAGGMHSFQDEGVDLACYLVRELRAMAVIADKLGKVDDKRQFTQQADALSARINDVFWDNADGFYYDRKEKTGKLVRLKSVVGFLPLWAGVAPPDRAARLVKEHLTNPAEFWLAYPIATYARTEPDFYEGRHGHECNWQGTAWIPTNYMIFHGLLRCGYKDVARDLARRTFDMVFNQNPVTREYYDSDTGHGNGMNPFWGWSSLGYGMLLEADLNYDPSDLAAPIVPIWKDSGVSFTEHPKVN